MQPAKEKKYYTYIHVVLVGLLLVIIVLSFYAFMRENTKRVLGQNRNYIEDVTKQTTSRVNDLLNERRQSLEVISITVTRTIKEPWVSQELLKVLQDASTFDYLEFVDANGLNHNADGVESDSTDRENYIEGMKGNTGISVIFNSRITRETLIDFYTPVYFEGKIIGVLNGMYREVTLQKAISTEMFDVSAKTYLCMEDGTVISSHGDDNAPDNILKGLQESSFVSNDDLEKIKDAFTEHESYNYTYAGTKGTGNAALVAIPDSNWMLLQTFPSELTYNMVRSANAAGIKLELRLLIIFLCYLCFMIWRNIRQRKKLMSEKDRLSWIVEGILPLFSRFVILDYEKNTYEYVENTQRGIAAKGSLDELIAYMTPHYIEEEKLESAANLLSREEVQERLTEDIPYLQYEYRIRWEEECWENASVLSLRRKAGVPVSVLLAIQDVTLLKEQEQEIRQTLMDAFHAAEGTNYAKSEFLSRMSHDMRTPMNAIMGMTAIALNNLDNESKVYDCLKKIDLSSQHLLALINEVLDMSKIESGKFILNEEDFCLSDVIKRCVFSIQAQAAAKKQILDIVPCDFLHDNVTGDAVRLQQVLVNLMDNAVKYTPAGGSIFVKTREIPSRVLGAACYEIVIKDSGIGMEPEFVSHVFEPFTRSETSQQKRIEGTGLGMPIAKNIIQLMNGNISVESELNRGTQFTVQFFLKLQKEALQPEKDNDVSAKDTKLIQDEESGSTPEHKQDYQGVRVLLVEDNELNMEIAVEMLNMAGVQVETAADGQQAVDLVKERPPYYYGLIFMDIQMPNKNGYEATKEIRSMEREDLKQIPIIALSANAFSQDIRKSKEAGMNDHMAKPVGYEKFLQALETWL